ncbi:enoyl-CoA hydratase/isomerase family protein [Labrenzia sp. PHM005]|uniref:enoyl-CoA hydratase/isomerase family protein n=1 Tax=Labrenzia sp. PHM005 TaxID=2590016 RepID=UPI001140440F|nr:enoyl-CoA hydratase/isomerase family protein [Labrenzia sp. PHM005]QDG75883.1 enoyl-CoA hydratase/isomerase family protein [Labrenzia sp. PHM005]
MNLIETEDRDGAIWLYLNKPARHNALVQPLLDEMLTAIERAKAHKPTALVVSARGRSFSTGGDVGSFLENATSEDQLLSYADKLVGSLHDVIMALLAFPAPVLAAINGPVTGGSTGLLLAADMVAMADHAFVQPYYSEVGFGPDGGWTALLPEKVGTSKALEIQYLNTRIKAADARDLGLVTELCPASELDKIIESWVSEFSKRFSQTHSATRQNIWDAARCKLVQQRLDHEKSKFLELIVRPETFAGMTTFAKRSA